VGRRWRAKTTINPGTKVQAVFWQLYGYKKKCLKLGKLIFAYFLRLFFLKSTNLQKPKMLLISSGNRSSSRVYGHTMASIYSLISGEVFPIVAREPSHTTIKMTKKYNTIAFMGRRPMMPHIRQNEKSQIMSRME
jgi:hypothetical protein